LREIRKWDVDFVIYSGDFHMKSSPDATEHRAGTWLRFYIGVHGADAGIFQRSQMIRCGDHGSPPVWCKGKVHVGGLNQKC